MTRRNGQDVLDAMTLGDGILSLRVGYCAIRTTQQPRRANISSTLQLWPKISHSQVMAVETAVHAWRMFLCAAIGNKLWQELAAVWMISIGSQAAERVCTLPKNGGMKTRIVTLHWRIKSLPAWCLTLSILLCQITALYSIQCSLDTTYVTLLRVL
jgi:hypothetical protein